MNKHTLLRILCGLTFLIFLCPFFQMCSDERIENRAFKKVSVNDNETLSNNENDIKETRKEITFNGYELSYTLAKENPFKHLDEWFLYSCISLFLILAISVLLLIFFLLNKYYHAKKLLAIVNLVLAFLFILFLIIDGSLEEITQIKYGYYLFIINTFAITLLSKKLTDHGI